MRHELLATGEQRWLLRLPTTTPDFSSSMFPYMSVGQVLRPFCRLSAMRLSALLTQFRQSSSKALNNILREPRTHWSSEIWKFRCTVTNLLPVMPLEAANFNTNMLNLVPDTVSRCSKFLQGLESKLLYALKVISMPHLLISKHRQNLLSLEVGHSPILKRKENQCSPGDRSPQRAYLSVSTVSTPSSTPSEQKWLRCQCHHRSLLEYILYLHASLTLVVPCYTVWLKHMLIYISLRRLSKIQRKWLCFLLAKHK